jgi:hypothetical protein
MSLKEPQSELRLFNVPWQPNDNNWLLWDNGTIQAQKFGEYFEGLSSNDKYSSDNYNIIKNGVVKVNTNMYKINTFNYMMFKNPDISSTKVWWYAFVDRIEWLSYNSCAVHYHLDAWQCFQHRVTFKKCYIERSHVPQHNATDSQAGDWKKDIAGNYLAPEPVSVTPQVEDIINEFNTDKDGHSLSWTPAWVLHSTSKYVNGNYVYSGDGTGATLTAEYGKFVSNTSDIQNVIEKYGRKSPEEIANDVSVSSGNTKWQDWVNKIFTGQALSEAIESVKATTSIADLQDHRNELIGLYAIPSWVKGSTSDWATNNIVHKEVKVNLRTGSLSATGTVGDEVVHYKPRNKKMLTSMCKGYAVYTQNGFKVALKPELFKETQPIMHLYGCQMATDGFMLHVGDYGTPSNTYYKLGYSCQGRIGYDANTGLDKTLNQLSTAIGGIGTLTGAGSQLATGNYIGAGLSAGNSIAGARDMIDALGQRGVNTGSSGNLVSITDGRPIPKFVDIGPKWAECEYIDDYLDVYGYAIDEINTVNITSRPYWNYIKVAKLNAKIDAPDEYASVIKNAFESGVHIWHTTIGNVGNFGLKNEFNNNP